ncbi:hypothetical protein GGI07_004204, partial [Coemansia sp. Benny D115]
MSRLSESPGGPAATPTAGSDEQARGSKRQSRFQGHWDSASISAATTNASSTTSSSAPVSGPLAFQPSSFKHPVSALADSQRYAWDMQIPPANKPTTPHTAMGLQTFADSAIHDDWSDLLNQSGSPSSAVSNGRSAGYPGLSLGRIGMDGSASASGSGSGNGNGGSSSLGDHSAIAPRTRRQLVDIIQTDFPRTPSPAVGDAAASALRARSSQTPLQRQASGDGGTSAAEPHSYDGGAIGAGGQQQSVAASSSAFSALSTSAPNRNPNFASPSGLLTDTNILGIPVRQPSVAPPSRSHSTVLLSASNNDAPNVGLMLNSLLDQDDESAPHQTAVDIFGMSVGSPPRSSAAASSGAAAAGAAVTPGAAVPGQFLWAARQAARLDGLQRAASTPPKNAAAVAAAAAAAAAAAGTSPGAPTSMWGSIDANAGHQMPLLRDNSLLGHSPAGPLAPAALNIGGGNHQLGADDLSYRIRHLRLNEDGGRGLRSAELRGSHDIFADIDAPVSARVPGSMSSVSD